MQKRACIEASERCLVTIKFANTKTVWHVPLSTQPTPLPSRLDGDFALPRKRHSSFEFCLFVSPEQVRSLTNFYNFGVDCKRDFGGQNLSEMIGHNGRVYLYTVGGPAG